MAYKMPKAPGHDNSLDEIRNVCKLIVLTAILQLELDLHAMF
jgi:hypothetical protein